MVSKKQRHQLVLKIIENESIERQEDIADSLNKMGVNVTQATVSRDIHDMGLVKQNIGGVVRYVLPSKGDASGEFKTKIAEIFTNSVVNVDYAKNIVVIKTLSGMANAAASAVDAMHSDFILGCIAGDDTIFIVVRTDRDAVYMAETLEKMRR